MKEIKEGRLKKYLMMFFDTYLAKGSEILSKKLELNLKDIINERLLKKLSKRY